MEFSLWDPLLLKQEGTNLTVSHTIFSFAFFFFSFNFSHFMLDHFS